jgi:hypothetical protein
MFDKIISFDKTIFVNGAGLAAVASGHLQTPANTAASSESEYELGPLLAMHILRATSTDTLPCISVVPAGFMCHHLSCEHPRQRWLHERRDLILHFFFHYQESSKGPRIRKRREPLALLVMKAPHFPCHHRRLLPQAFNILLHFRLWIAGFLNNSRILTTILNNNARRKIQLIKVVSSVSHRSRQGTVLNLPTA